MSPRQELLDAMRDSLQRILLASGYNTNVGTAVTLEPSPKLNDEVAEFVSAVWMQSARATDPALLRTHRLATVRVWAKVKATVANAQGRVDLLLDDVERAMADQQFRYPTGIEFPKFQTAEPMAGAVNDGWVGIAVDYASHIPIRRPAA